MREINEQKRRFMIPPSQLGKRFFLSKSLPRLEKMLVLSCSLFLLQAAFISESTASLTLKAGRTISGYNGMDMSFNTTVPYITYVYINFTVQYSDGNSTWQRSKTPVFPHPSETLIHIETVEKTPPFIIKITVEFCGKHILRYGISFGEHIIMRQYPSFILTKIKEA